MKNKKQQICGIDPCTGEWINPSIKKITPQVGDILCGTFGYEACIAVFAKVISVNNRTIQIVELERNNVYQRGGMDWVSSPMIDNPIGEIMTKLIKVHGDSYKIKWDSYTYLYKWNGKPVNCFNYH